MDLSTEEIQRRIKNYKLLNIHYDSGELLVKEVPTKISYTIDSELRKDSYYGIRYKHSVNKILGFANQKVADFFIADNIEEFNCKFKFGNKEIGVEVTRDFDFDKALLAYIETVEVVPKVINCDVVIERKPNVDARKDHYIRNRNGKTPEEVFLRICSAESTGYNKPSHWNSPFKGLIRSQIYNSYKDPAIFLIEYLYGKKLARNTTFKQIYRVLSGLPYDTFGLLDVQDIKKFDEHFRYLHTVQSAYDTLYNTIGLKPKTDLKRWKKNGLLRNAPEIIETR